MHPILMRNTSLGYNWHYIDCRIWENHSANSLAMGEVKLKGPSSKSVGGGVDSFCPIPLSADYIGREGWRGVVNSGYLS